MDDIKFSVIIPVYNTQKYLKKCIKSILKQTYGNFEAILVNDGSTDKSEKIIRKFADKNNKIRLINQPNSGASAARRTGVNNAEGDYVIFVDSDDWIKPDTLERCRSAIKENDADIVQYDADFILGPFRRKSPKKEAVIISREDFFNKYIYGLAGGYGAISRGISKVYRKEIIKTALKKQTHKLKIWEDGYMNLIAFSEPETQKIVLLNEPLYCYRRGSGITASKDEEMQYTECMKSKKLIYDFLVDNNISDFFLQTCLSENAGMTEYYLTDKFSECSASDKMSVIRNTLEIPAVKQITDYITAHPEWKDPKTDFLKLDINELYKYLEKQSQKRKNDFQIKIKLLLHKFF